MTDKQPDALRLAGLLELAPEDGVDPQTTEDAAAELRRLHAENETLRAKIKTYEDLDEAASDVQLLRTGYAAARLEIESPQARIKTMTEEQAELRRLSGCCPELNLSNYGPDDVDELNGWAIEVSQCIDRALAAQPAGAQQPAPSAAAVQTIPGVQWQCGPQANGFTAPQADSQPAPVRCPACSYQYGHAIGCENNPVDISLATQATVASHATADSVLEDAARTLIEAIEYTPLGVRAITAMNQLRVAIAARKQGANHD